MEIHELNTFSGTPGANDYLATDNGNDTSKISITSITDPLNARIDNIIAGPAPSAQEVIDARRGANGTNYASLGDAIRGQINGINSNLEYILYPYNAVDLFYPAVTRTNATDRGITFTHDHNRCNVSGTATGQALHNLYVNRSALPIGMVAGGTYNFVINTLPTVSIVIFFYDSAQTLIQTIRLRQSQEVTFPAATAGIIARIEVDSGATVNGYIEYAALSTMSNEQLLDYINNRTVVAKDFLPNNTDINTVENGIYGITDTRTYPNLPEYLMGRAGTIIAVKIASNYILQLGMAYLGTDNKVYRRYKLSDAWLNWAELGGGGGGGTNEYNFITNENTYNITSTPTITTDTNNYLASTNDTTDRTADIVQMLTANKVCRLGPGVFYVKDLQMPVETAIIGSGNSTKIIMAAGDGCAIQMSDYCTVEDCSILGSATSINIPTSIGNRHGILWSGNFTETQSSGIQPKMGTVSNVLIAFFTGGAITCQDTGYGTFNQLEVVNAYIRYCGVGINIPYISEFHKFTNVRTNFCLYGCINNGGNNVFVNCDFSSCTQALLIDNSQNQSPNNSHGSMIGCVFNHTNNNEGIGIEVLNCPNGFVFDGCQIFFSQIKIENSDGIIVSNCNFGLNNCNITINGGHAILFANNMHQGRPPISITNNNYVHFVNCYNRSSGAVISN